MLSRILLPTYLHPWHSHGWMRRRPVVTLVGIGLFSQAVYLIYVLLFPLAVYGYAPRPYDMEQIARDRPWMGMAWMAGLVLLFGLYAVALWDVGRTPIPLRVIFAFSLPLEEAGMDSLPSSIVDSKCCRRVWTR